jgi:NodT family efflux transporter outer membrane factor (OMF) lipoprotein
MIRPPAFSTPLLLFVAGCTVGPDFKAPQPRVPAQWEGQSPALEGPSAPAAWWEAFGDPELSSLVRRAMDSNLDLRQAVLRIAEARAARDVSAPANWPSLSADGAFARQRISERTATTSLLAAAAGGGKGSLGAGTSGAIAGLPNPFNQAQYGLDASWEIDLFGRVRRSIEAAEAQTQSSVEEGHDALVTLAGDVAKAYIDLRGAQARRAIVLRNLGELRTSLELIRERRQAGYGTEAEVAAFSAEVSTADGQLPGLDAEVTRDINGLSLLVALQPGALRGELASGGPVPPSPPSVPAGLPGELLRRRPDIRRTEAQLHAAIARVGIAKADLFPSVTLNAAAGFEAERGADLTDWAARFGSIGPAIDLPLFDAGRRRATVRLEDVRSQEAAIAYSRTVLNAVHEVDNALVAHAAAQRRRISLEAAVAQSRAARDVARLRYEDGLTSFLEVLDAERTADQADLALADATAALATDVVALYKALGGGWKAD